MPDLGFKNIEEYYEKQSSDKTVDKIQIPLLTLNSDDDMIIDSGSIPLEKIRKNENIIHLKVKGGGHIGYLTGAIPKFVIFLLI